MFHLLKLYYPEGGGVIEGNTVTVSVTVSVTVTVTVEAVDGSGNMQKLGHSIQRKE